MAELKPLVGEPQVMLDETGPAGRFRVLVAPVVGASALMQPSSSDYVAPMGVLLHRVGEGKPTMEACFGHADLARFHALMATEGCKALAQLLRAVEQVVVAKSSAEVVASHAALEAARFYGAAVDAKGKAIVAQLEATLRAVH